MGEFPWNEKDAIAYTYIQDMLRELRQVAAARDAQMLVYLLDVAAEEASELMAGKRSVSLLPGKKVAKHTQTTQPVIPASIASRLPWR